MKTKVLKKGDLFLALALLMIAVIVFCFILFRGMEEATSITIEVDGRLYGKYSMKEDKIIKIKGHKTNDCTNIVQVKDGVVFIREASCPDQYCVKHKPINRRGETIVCLPNKLIVTVDKGKDCELDAVTN